jgi:hypothetical protein
MADTAAASTLIDRLLDEILVVVAGAGIHLPEDDPRALIHAHCRERSNLPSMLQHLMSGRRTEIDALNGAVVRRGQTLGIATPFNVAIVLIVKAMEAAARLHRSTDWPDWTQVNTSAGISHAAAGPITLNPHHIAARQMRIAGMCNSASRPQNHAADDHSEPCRVVFRAFRATA